MKQVIIIAQVVISIALASSILLQKQGSSLGGIFGGTSENYYSRRGFIKLLFYITIGLSVLFLGLGAVNLTL